MTSSFTKKRPFCRWCETSTDLIRAHIIPRTFYNAVREKTKVAILLRPEQGKYTEVSQSGVFDPRILCEKCDALLGRLDEYGFSIFKSPPTDSDLVVDRDRMPVGFDLHCGDIQRAQQFILSMLWRASVTSHDFFDGIHLGKDIEDRIRKLISDGKKITQADFEFIVIRYFNHPYDSGIMPPLSGRILGIRVCYFYLPFFKIVIRVDQRQLKHPFTLGQFSEGVQPQCLRMSYSDTLESRYMSGLAASLRAREAGAGG